LEKEKLTQKDLASLAGVKESALSRYINDDRQPKLEVLANIATALNTTIEYLATGKSEEEDFDAVYKLVARSSYTMSAEQKMKIIEAVMKAR
jgi:transcriptional regulator with XRE-family HTH domain